MPDFAVDTAFGAKDRVSGAFSKMDRRAEKFGRTADKAFKRASRSANRFDDIVKGILAAGVISKGLGLLRQGVGEVARQFVGFDQAVTSASAKFKGLNLSTEEGQKTLERLKKTARDVGAATQFSAGQAAEGLDFLAMAGFDAEQSMAALPGVVDLATVANLDLARSTDISSDSLGAFGLMTKDANQLQQNFTRLNDVMALTMSRTNTNMEDMFESIKKGAPAFTSAGQSMESFNALLGVMANSGVKGAESGTALRNVMLRLAKPTAEAQKQLDALGVRTQDSEGNFRDVVDILADVEKGLKGMGSAQKSAALATIFGARTVTGVNILLQEGSENIRSFRDELLNAAGASQKMADIMRQSLQNRLLSLQSAAIELGFKIFEAFEERGANAIDTMTEAIRAFDPKPIIEGIEAIIMVLKFLWSIAKPIINAFVAFGKFLGIAAAEILTLLEGPAAGGRKIEGSLFGEIEESPPRRAPNEEQARARQDIRFTGRMEFANAPAGATVESKTEGAPDIDMAILGEA
jgi:TP901 family phage tail tape measure protein